MKIDYYAYRSGMNHWNSGLKVLLSIGTLVLTVGLDNVLVSLVVILSMGYLTLQVGKIPWNVYRKLLAIPLTFMLFSSFAIATSFARQPVGQWNIHIWFFWLCFTKQSIFTAINVLIKAMAGMSALYMMSLSTPVNEIILVLQKLHLPSILVELMNLIYRYLFILLDVSLQLQTASKARLGDRNFVQACKSFAGVAGNLFLIALRKGNAYYDALLSRGYDGTLEFLTEERPIEKRHAIGTILFFAVLLLLGVAGGVPKWNNIFYK